jgi:phosphoglycerol transferase MdoB-like AlkP superfamily enzyme
MSITMKKSVPIALVFITSLVFLAEYFVFPAELKDTVTMLQNWGIILTAFTLGFGAVNMFVFHGKQVSRRAKGQWPYSLWLLIILVIFTVIGVAAGAASTQYSWLYNSSYFALSATVYSSLGFYMTSGIYRALRAKNAESALLLIVGIISLARNAPALAAKS